MQAAVEAAWLALTLGDAPDPDDAKAVDAWLRRQELPESEWDQLRGPALRRLLIYRELVQQTLRDAIELTIPRCKARLGQHFERYFSAYLQEIGPRSPYLREVAFEFVAFITPRLREDPGLPRYLADLARHEALQIELAAMPSGPVPSDCAAPSLDAALSVIAPSRLMQYEHAVQRLSEDLADRSAALPEPTQVLAYRSTEHEVRYLELSPLAAALIEFILGGATLRDALQLSTRKLGIPLDDDVLQGSAALLSDLCDRGVLSGPPLDSHPSPAAHERYR